MSRLAAVVVITAYFSLAAFVAAVKAQTQGAFEGCAYNTTTRAICAIFGPYRWQALRVAACESSYSVWARNGQYFGVFQMGVRERGRYGGSTSNPWEQVRAAHRYFADAHWSPWHSSSRCSGVW